jgi:SgrR family transcriptional regulator
VRQWLSHLFQPANLLYHAGEHYQGNWFPAYGLLPRWHHAQPRLRKTGGAGVITLTYYRDHVEHRVIGGIMATLLAAHQVKLEIQELDYDEWHRGEVVSDIWLTAPTSPADRFSLFAYLYEVPLIQHCIPIDWQQDAAAGARAR